MDLALWADEMLIVVCRVQKRTVRLVNCSPRVSVILNTSHVSLEMHEMTESGRMVDSPWTRIPSI
jgi:hypothetical protein